MTEAVFVQPRNVSGATLTQALAEVSFDAGQTFRALTAAEVATGLIVQVQQKFTIRVSLPHYTPVTQALIVNAPPKAGKGSTLGFDGPTDFGSGAFASIQKDSGTPLNQHFFNPWITLFRDGGPVRLQAGQTPLSNTFAHSVVAWSGAAVLNAGGTAYARFAGQVTAPIQCVTPGIGKLNFGLTVDSAVPQLAPIYIPDSLDLTAPIPVIVFFPPSTGAKNRPYPFSNGPSSFNEFMENYLMSGGKRLLSQLVASKVQCVFVLPVPPPSGYLSGIQDAARLRQYCLEVAFFVQRFVGGKLIPDTTLGRCAVAAFSEGGRAMHNVVATSGAFPELKEVYGLDVVPPSGSAKDSASYQQMLSTLARWHDADADRHVRLYTHFDACNTAGNFSIKPSPSVRNGRASESRANNATFAFLPFTGFWDAISTEQVGTQPNPSIDFSGGGDTDRATHQLIPAMMFGHALTNSGFKKG